MDGTAASSHRVAPPVSPNMRIVSLIEQTDPADAPHVIARFIEGLRPHPALAR